MNNNPTGINQYARRNMVDLLARAEGVFIINEGYTPS